MSNIKNKTVVSIAGMHCRSCEILVEDSLSAIPGVQRSVVNYKKGTAEIHYTSSKLNMHEVETAIREAGYSVGIDGKKPLFSKNPEDYKDLGIAAFFLAGIYIIFTNLGFGGISFAGAGGTSPSSLPVVFLVGITAGLSTCMALVGGLILGISARHAELHPEATPMQKFRPHLFFNLGRIGGYAILGGVLGAMGSVFQLSGSTMGILTIVVGFVMLMLGMKLTGLFPRMENGSISLPTGVSKFFGIKKQHEKEYSHKGSMVTGALTFFLPCGFTQAMQLYAISTGSFTRGFLIMGIFALGTAPGLLGVGGLTSVIKGIFAKRFFKFAGILVIFLAMFNISNGYNLTGLQLGSALGAGNAATAANDPNVKLENGVQVVSMVESSSGYSPNKFTIKKGVPVRWEIDAQAPNSCASSLVSSKINVRKTLVAGKNVIEFTPAETGSIPFSCAMGMYTGVFTVVDENSSASDVAAASKASSAQPAAAAHSCGGGGGASGGGGGCGGGASGGGGCGGSGKPVVPSTGTVETAPAADAAKTNEQVIKTSYTLSNDIQPNTFTVKAGQPVKLVVDVKENGQGCMSTITIPNLATDVYQLTAGKSIEFAFTPTKKGVYQITCAMGVPRGTITVE
jgi:sulfite exporter TauE/SafE/plastocyanin domain-containing protein/copper chaperone CopZ